MTEKQKNFCDEFILTQGNASQAARRAGYSEMSCRVTANRLLNNGKVRAAIDERLDELKTKRLPTFAKSWNFCRQSCAGK